MYSGGSVACLVACSRQMMKRVWLLGLDITTSHAKGKEITSKILSSKHDIAGTTLSDSTRYTAKAEEYIIACKRH